jgi:hypothetical protein
MPKKWNISAERAVFVLLAAGYALIIISQDLSGLRQAGLLGVGIGSILVAVVMTSRIICTNRLAERRKNRDECLGCGYPLGTSIICPECGKAKS